jgi:hypothetical protein
LLIYATKPLRIKNEQLKEKASKKLRIKNEQLKVKMKNRE